MVKAISIRRLSAGGVVDRGTWLTIREICCRTGNNGEPVPDERWEFFARIWIEPYQKIVPEWTYVAECDNAIVGYLTGCPDSMRFNRAKLWRCTVPLLVPIVLGSFRRIPGAVGWAARELGMRPSAEGNFSLNTRRDIARFYPAHLHMNVERKFRRIGIGQRLLETYFADLKRAGIGGIHLFCGADPLPFYHHSGFRTLEKSRFRDVDVFALGQRW